MAAEWYISVLHRHDHPEARYNLALCLYKLAKYQDALKHLEICNTLVSNQCPEVPYLMAKWYLLL